jgi:hypothetical protein
VPFFLWAHQFGGSRAIHRLTGIPGQAPIYTAPSLSAIHGLAVVGNDCQSAAHTGSSFRTLFSLAGGGNTKESFPIFQREKRFPKAEARDRTRSNCPGKQNLHSVRGKEEHMKNKG